MGCRTFLKIYHSALVSTRSSNGVVKREHTNLFRPWMKKRLNGEEVGGEIDALDPDQGAGYHYSEDAENSRGKRNEGDTKDLRFF